MSQRAIPADLADDLAYAESELEQAQEAVDEAQHRIWVVALQARRPRLWQLHRAALGRCLPSLPNAGASGEVVGGGFGGAIEATISEVKLLQEM